MILEICQSVRSSLTTCQCMKLEILLLCLKMSAQFTLIVFVLVMVYHNRVNCSVGNENLSSLNSIDSHRTTTKINFLKKEIEIPDGVSEAIAFEIQKILNDYENRLLKFGRDLISCDGSSSQQEKYLKSYNQFKEIETGLRGVPNNLKQRFMSRYFNAKSTKQFFDISHIFDRVFNIIDDISVLFNFQVNVMKPGNSSNPTTVPPTTPPTAPQPNPPTDPPATPPTNPPTDSPAKPSTNPPTDPTTKPPIEPPTDPTTKPPTDETTTPMNPETTTEGEKRKPSNSKP